jgi:predicted amidohydrolase YtcJ
LGSVNNTSVQIDLAIVNGKIWTENPNQPHAEALAITASRISAVGDSKTILNMAGPRTRIIDVQGRRIVPGFNDAHLHFYMGGDTLTSVDLRNANSHAELRERIAAFARTAPRGEWILNGSWDQERWTPSLLPTHELIDSVTPDHPLWVNRTDGHMMLANAVAMRLAGVDRNTPDVPGGEIVRDRAGNPTGVFKDAAKRLVDWVIPLPSHDHILSAISAAQQHTARNGITSVQDMGVLGSRGGEVMIHVIRAYREMQSRGELKVRISARIPLSQWRNLGDPALSTCFGTDKLHLGGVKSFSDGSLGSTTAWFFEPYSDAPCSCGLPSDEFLNPEQAYANLRDADASGLQVAIHAIGDRANSVVLDMWQRLASENGERDRRARIEHAQHLRPSDFARFAQLKVIASVQPYHCIDDARWAYKRIGHERARGTYAFRSLLDAGVRLAFGSDWWVAPLNPLMGIYAAVTRRSLDGQFSAGWEPEQKISVSEAVHAYTYQAAYASHEEDIKGSLEPGKLADLVVLSGDIFSINPVSIEHVKVDMTIFDGEVTFEREPPCSS